MGHLIAPNSCNSLSASFPRKKAFKPNTAIEITVTIATLIVLTSLTNLTIVTRRGFGAYPSLTLCANPIEAVIADLSAGLRRLGPVLAELFIQAMNAQQLELKRNSNNLRALALLHTHSSHEPISRPVT